MNFNFKAIIDKIFQNEVTDDDLEKALSTFDPITRRKFLKYAGLGVGAGVLYSLPSFPEPKLEPKSDIYTLDDGIWTTELPKREVLTTEPAKVKKHQGGWYMEEIQGITVVNARAVIQGTLF